MAVQRHQFTSKLKLYKSLVTSILLYGCETLTLLADSEEEIQTFVTKCLMAQRLGAEHNQLPLWVHKNLSWQLSRDGNLHGLGMSHTKTASPKPSFKAT